MPLATELFDYTLPEGQVALTPAARRDHSRLLVVDRGSREVSHGVFADLPSLLKPGDCLFRNNASVIRGRLRAVRPGGGGVECLLVEKAADEAQDGNSELWRCLVRPGRKLPAGARFAHPDGLFACVVLERERDGAAMVRFSTRDGDPVAAVAARVGEVPLPPYLGRRDASQSALDRDRYQTVYADPSRPVAAAAPTAGLHFTSGLLASLAARGIQTSDITLNVGLGTFQPISTDTIEAHPIHRERYEIPALSQRRLFPPLPGRRIAVGTTSARAIEDFLGSQAAPGDGVHRAEAAIYLDPPRRFAGVDALITNFHQPRSTLLCLVSAFLTPGETGGIAWLREIYADAIGRGYRFYSYGDAMLIL
jgi:S-adenosylmethionine:tRNA ribosyltransferase-isomerase